MRFLKDIFFIVIFIITTGIGNANIVYGAGNRNTIKIGAILALEGSAGPIMEGVDVRDGMLLAIGEINTWGGVRGKKVELVIQDTGGEVQRGIENFQNIEKFHNPLFYVSMYSSISMAIAPFAAENEVVLIGVIVTAPEFTSLNRWVYSYWPDASIEIEPILTLLKKLNIKKLGVLYLNDEYGRSLYRLIKERFEKMGGVISGEAFSQEEKDFSRYITGLKDMEAVYIIGFSDHTAQALKQLSEKGYKGKRFATNAVTSPILRKIIELNNVFSSSPLIYNQNFPFAKEVMENFEKKYGRRISHYAAAGYDCIRMIGGLLEHGEVSRKNLLQLLQDGFTYAGVLGDVDIKPGEQNITFPLYPGQIVNGEVKYLW